MTVKFTTVPSKRLSETINASAYSFSLQDIKGWNGSNVADSDFGTELYASFRNSLGTKMELMKIDPSTIASSSITILKRGLGFDGDQTTEVTANIQDVWVKGDTIVEIGSHVPQLLEETVRKSGNQTIAGVKTFTEIPQTAGIATAANDIMNYATALSMLTGSTSVNRLQVAGTAGENLTVGNLVYLKLSDGLWWKCDADTAATVDNIILGIAQATTTSGNSISGGVLLQGLDTNQTGLTDKTTYYASNTAGAISSTPGTTEVTLGVSRSTTSLLFIPRYNQQLTEDQQDALAGTSGTPSGSNKFVTNDDTSATSASSKVVRTNSSGYIDNGFQASGFRLGGTGADGALAIASGTTTIDLGGAAVFTKNYTSISITGTGALAFSNPHASGTIIILKSQGNVTLTSSATPMIDLRSLGGSAGVGAASSGGAASGGNAAQPTSNGVYSTLMPATGGGPNSGSVQGTGGTAPNLVNTGKYGIPLVISTGGGGGGDGGTGGAAGGRAGGGLVLECAGAFNFTTANGINASGANGSTGTANVGAGGGGAGGFVYVIYNTLTANSGTIVVTGGTGGTGNGANGNAGGGGASQTASGTNGTGKGSTGGAGGAGWSLVVANTN